jgi:hypothetical protein
MLLVVSCWANAQQDHIPTVYEPPIIGFESIRNTNGYLLQQNKDSSGNWVNTRKFIRTYNNQLKRATFESVHDWKNQSWQQVLIDEDSIIFNTNGKVQITYNRRKLTLPTFNQNEYTKYEYTYNQDQPVSVRVSNAVPPNSNNWNASFFVQIRYDQNERRVSDSIRYYQNNFSLVIYYIYDSQGRVIGEFGLNGSDSVNKITYVYGPDGILTSVTEAFDNSADTWMIQSADTFEYENGKIVKHSMFGTIFTGTEIITGPYQMDLYTYDNEGKLASIVEHEFNNGWKPKDEYSMLYNGATLQIVELRAYQNGTPNTDVYSRFLPSPPTSLNEQSKSISTSINIYPNPTNEYLYIEGVSKIKSIKFINATGQSIEANIDNGQISTANIPAGIYQILLVHEEQVVKLGKIAIEH